MKKLLSILIFSLLASSSFAQTSRQIQSSDVTGALGYTPLSSIGGMAGPAITCGANITCVGNTISASGGGGGGSPGGTNGQIQYNNSGAFGGFTVGGDATLSTGTGALTLATVNANTGSFGSGTSCVSFTTNSKGLITAASSTICTPDLANLTGLGTGVSTALAVNAGTAGSFVINGGALGTPSSGNLMHAIGLVPSTGINATGTPSASTYLRGDNTWATVAGSGTVTTTGTPASGNLTAFSGSTSITNSNLSGDCTTSGTLAVTCTKTNGVAFATSATTDATNANNLSSGTIPNARFGTAPTSWTPTDQSGAGLTFTGVSANYVRMGNMVFAYGTLTYPGTANGSNAAIGGLPVTSANQAYLGQCSFWSNVSSLSRLQVSQNSTNFIPYTSAGLGITNASFSGLTINFMCIYPAT